MLISYKKKFIFIHVFKVAGSSIKRGLGDYAHKPERKLINKLLRKSGTRVTIPHYKYKVFPHHITANELKQEIPEKVYDGFFKFAFVRNPWDWQVSLYHFMLQKKSHYQYNIVSSMKSFDEYVEWRVTKDKVLQKNFVVDENGSLIVDFIGKYENLSEDFKYLCDILNLEASLPHANKSKHGNYRSYYNKRTAGLIEKHYQDDIEFFKYKF